MKLHDFYYDLPQELIAQDPLEDRTASRLMHMDRKTGQIEHKVFSDVIDYLNEGDCLVINDREYSDLCLAETIYPKIIKKRDLKKWQRKYKNPLFYDANPNVR